MKRILFIPTAAAIVFSFTTVYSQNGVGVNTNTPRSSFEDNGSFGKVVTTITGSTNLNETHATIVCNNGATPIAVTLPAANTCSGRMYEIKRNAASTALVTVTATIDGVTNYLLTNANQSVTVFSDGANWQSRDGAGDNLNWRVKGNAGTNPSNDFVGTTDAQDLVFRTNNSEKMRIESGGDVGIGTTNPSTKLEVLANASGANVITSINTSVSGYSSVDYKDNSSALRFTVGYANGSATNFAGKAYANTYGSDFVLSKNAPATDLFMQGNNGNIGLGNSAPQQNLSVQNGMNIDQASINNGNTTNILTFGSNSGEGIGSKRTATGNQYGLDFYTGFNNRMVITSAGNVGIGVTTPSCRLDVRDDASGIIGDVKLQIARQNAGDVGMTFNQVSVKSFGIVLRDNSAGAGTRGRLAFVDSYFPGSALAAQTEIMCIGPVPNGNVGIGINAPVCRLDLDGNSNSSALRIRGTAETVEFTDMFVAANGAMVIDNKVGSGTGRFIDLRPIDDQFGLVLRESDQTSNDAYANFYVSDVSGVVQDYLTISVSSATNSNAVHITAQNRIGIGTTAPTCPLDIDLANNDSYSNYGRLIQGSGYSTNIVGAPDLINTSIRTSGFIAGQGFIATSDARVKKNIKQVDNVSDLELLKKMNLVHFKYIDTLQSSTYKNKGVIAQEIKKIIPEAVNQSRKVIPNVFELSQKLVFDSVLKTISITVSKPHDFKVGDTIRVYDSQDKMHDVVVAKTSNQNTFTINDWNTYTSRIFVYGRFVNDFHTVNYDYLFTTGLSAMQEMIRHQELQEKQIDQLKASNQSIQNRLAEIESLLKGELKEVSVLK